MEWVSLKIKNLPLMMKEADIICEKYLSNLKKNYLIFNFPVLLNNTRKNSSSKNLEDFFNLKRNVKSLLF